MYVTTSKQGRHAISLVCKRSGEHLRGFINDDAFVTATIGKIAEAPGVSVEQVVPPVPAAEDPAKQALQDHSEGPAPSRRSTDRRRKS